MILIALGANLPSPHGSPRATLEAALAALDAHGLTPRRRSHWYRTPAYPPGAGADFVNGAAALDGDQPAVGILRILHGIEAELGRSRDRRWEARACDLDLLAVDDRVLPDQATVRAWMGLDPAVQASRAPGELILPHPRLHERGFALRPLFDVAPAWRNPLLGRSVRELLAELPPAELVGIERLYAAEP